MKKIFNSFWIVILVATFVTILFSGKVYINRVTEKKTILYNSKMSPIIFVPGSSASNNRFNDMLASFNLGHQNHSILKVQVSTKNQVSYEGAIKSNDEHPYIVIAFDNNNDGYGNIKEQAKWLDIALKDLQERYQFKRFNAVGHSNGGLNWIIYLEKYYGSENFQMDNLLTIGTPYNFEESNLSNKTQMLKDLEKEKASLPKSLVVYNLAGTNTFDADKIVPYASVLAGKYIFQNVVKQYTQVTVTGDKATHTDLPSNPEVIQFVDEKLISPIHKGMKAGNKN
ncbi:alpha/beta hydrolase [Streptococcus catagoni]|uniref:alpha/beta hydrolase n=1 Tax=Streptococcus catagoni TaxID=2654874 RepID=UPI001409CA66|nr:alpha/beta hydrolase [Streptococcus catagoni]